MRWDRVPADSSFYLFMVIPHAQTFETLVGMLSVPYLGIGMLIQRPGFNLIAMLLSVNTASFANVQSVYDVNFLGLFNTSLANAAAMLFAPLWAMLARPFGAHVAAHRLIRASWQDLARAATVAWRRHAYPGWRADAGPAGATDAPARARAGDGWRRTVSPSCRSAIARSHCSARCRRCRQRAQTHPSRPEHRGSAFPARRRARLCPCRRRCILDSGVVSRNGVPAGSALAPTLPAR
jgi:uncharacterized membrane protein YccC